MVHCGRPYDHRCCAKRAAEAGQNDHLSMRWAGRLGSGTAVALAVLPAPCQLPHPVGEEEEDQSLPGKSQEGMQLPLLATKGFVAVAKDLAVDGGSKARKMSAKVADGAKVLSVSAWATLVEDWNVSYEASFDLITLWLCPPCFRVLAAEEQHRHWSILLNPLFWGMHLPLVVCILSGKWLHSLWGQGGKVRHDEMVEEQRVRTHWIYCLDGPIASLCVLDMVDVLLDVRAAPHLRAHSGRSSVYSSPIALDDAGLLRMPAGADVLAAQVRGFHPLMVHDARRDDRICIGQLILPLRDAQALARRRPSRHHMPDRLCCWPPQHACGWSLSQQGIEALR